jgi:hypothetical protein
MFRATVCPSSGETTVFMRHLVLVILKQVGSLKLQVRIILKQMDSLILNYPLVSE